MNYFLNSTPLETNLTANFTGYKHSDTNSSASLSAVVGLSIANILAIFFGTLGNSLVIVSIIINRGMRSTTNIFIASLAGADVIVTSTCMPLFFVYNVLTWPAWPYGKTGCRILSFLVHMSVMASALSLLAISYDRFVSVFFPMKRFITPPRAKKIVGVIWFVSPFLLLPSLFHHDVVSKGKKVAKCEESWSSSKALHLYQMYRISCYFLFLLQISVLYFLIGHRLYTRQQPGEQTSQSKAKDLLNKRKIIKMLFLVVALFALCWLPYMINKLLNIFPPRPGYVAPDLFVFVGNFLGLLNSVANPVVYAVLNTKFRKAFKNALRCNCNYELEDRRRNASIVSKQTQLRQSESITLDRVHRNSISVSDNQVVSFGRVGTEKTMAEVKCLSFTSIEQEAIFELSKFPTCSQSRGFSGRNPEKRRVSFGGELFSSLEKKDLEALTIKNGSFNLMNETGNCVNKEEQARHRCDTDMSNLSPIQEKGHINVSFEPDSYPT